MVFPWLVRVALIIGAFFLGNFVAFLMFQQFFWDSGSAEELTSRGYPTPQDWLNLITTAVGIALAVFVAVKSRRLTQRSGRSPTGSSGQSLG